MSYATAALFTLAAQCAPNVSQQTVVAIIKTESDGNPFAINVNGARQPSTPTSAATAAATARRFIAAGYSVDLGLGQINSRNMRWLGLTWDTVFDPCTNIAALGVVLTANYIAAKPGRDAQTALRVALSMYNTGSPTRGFRNGYVARVVGNAVIADPMPAAAFAAAQSDEVRAFAAAEGAALEGPVRPPRPAPPPKWKVFERAAYDRETVLLTANERGRT